MICKELNQEYSNDNELFAALKANKDQIITAKKSQIIKSIEKGISVQNSIVSKKLDTEIKGLNTDDYYYIAVNMVNILDSHNDLHVAGIWNKSAKEQQGKNYLVLDHEFSVMNTVARKEHIRMFVAEIPFKSTGKNYEGSAEALIYEVPKEKVINSMAKNWLDSGDAIEASVKMRYVDILLALNSLNTEDTEEKATFDKYAPIIANKQDFEDIKYFWVVKQAQNIGESSLLLAGSCPTTGLINANVKAVEPQKSTQQNNIEPSNDDTHNNQAIKFLNYLKLN